MADGDDPIPTRPPSPGPLKPGQPIPRLWKADPEPEEDAAPTRKSRKERLAEEREKAAEVDSPAKSKAKAKGDAKGKGKAKAKSGKDEPKRKGALIEATPESETYEARQRARLLIGGVMTLAVGLGILTLFRTFNPPAPPEEPSPDEGALMAAAFDPKKNANPSEDEAKILLATAQRLAKNGNTKGSIDVLNKVLSAYPKTTAATEAREALGRPSRNLPLFLDRPTVVASPTAPATKPAENPPAPVVNVAPANGVPVNPGAPSQARLDLPPNPAEAPRAPNPTTTPAAPTVTARPLPAGFRARTEAGLSASRWPNQIVSDRDGATMVLVPAGTFIQGRDDGTLEEGPEHKVTLDAYYIDQHEVTVRQFHFYLKETGGKLPATKAAPKGDASHSVDADELPVVNITAREAKAYCDWAGGVYLPRPSGKPPREQPTAVPTRGAPTPRSGPARASPGRSTR